MNQSKIHDFLFQDVSILNGVGAKTINLLKKKPFFLKNGISLLIPKLITSTPKLFKLSK